MLKMLKKIYQELVAIRKELQAIRSSLELSAKKDRPVILREPYSTNYKLFGAARDGSLEDK